VSHVLPVAAIKIGNPIAELISVEADNAALELHPAILFCVSVFS